MPAWPSLTTSGLSAVALDLASGAPLDLAGALAGARTERAGAARKEAAQAKAAAQRNLVQEVPATLARLRQEMGDAKLMGVWIEREQITFIQADRVMIDYDQRGRFIRRSTTYDQVWLCTQGFDDGEIDWSGLAALVDQAIVARKLDEEDRDYAAIAVERPRECAPTVIEVEFTNYKTPYPTVTFDAAGRLKRAK